MTILQVPAFQFIAAFVVIAVQTSAGAIIWRAVRRSERIDITELIGMGLAIGSFLALIAGVLLLPVLPPTVGWAIPALLVFVSAAIARFARGKKGSAPKGIDINRPPAIAAVIGIIAGVAALIPNLSNYPLTWSGIWNRYHPDMVFFEVLSKSVAQLGPNASLLQVDAEVRYHWFAYGWIGQISEASNLIDFAGLTRILPIAAIIGTVLIAAAWTHRATKSTWAPTLAVLLIITGGYVGAVNGTVLNFDSPSQELTSMWLLALAFAALLTIDQTIAVRAGLPIVAVLAIATTGGKVSAALVALAGLVAVAAIGMITRAEWKRSAVWVALTAAAAMLATYITVFLGSASSGELVLFSLTSRAADVQGLALSREPWGIVAGTFVLALAIIPRWAGVAFLIKQPAQRWQPTTWFALGSAGFSVLALIVLTHGVNDLWFALSASAPLAVISAIGVGLAFPRFTRKLALLALLGIALMVGVTWIWSTGSLFTVSWRWLGAAALIPVALLLAAVLRSRLRLHVLTTTALLLVFAATFARAQGFLDYRIAPKGPVPVSENTAIQPAESESPAAPAFRGWGEDERAAATFVQERIPRQEALATSSVSEALIPALTGHQTLISGVRYQAFIGRSASVAQIPALTDASVEPQTAELCALGARWFWSEHPAGLPALTPDQAVQVFSNASVTIWELPCPASP